MLSKIALIFILILSIYNSQPLYAADKIVATVNKDVITQSETDAYLSVIALELGQKYQGKELEEKINEEKNGLILKMAENMIIIQEAKRKGIQARLDKVKLRIGQIKEGFANEADFENMLRQKGLTMTDLEDKLSEQIIMREIIEREVKDKIVLSPKEVTAYYRNHREEFFIPEQRAVEAVYTEDEEASEKLHRDLKSGLDFKETAKQYQANYSQEAISIDQVRKEVADEVFSLRPNEISTVIKLDNRFYVFKLLETIPAKIQDLTTAHNYICAYLYQEKFIKMMGQWLDRLKAKSYIEIRHD